MNNDHDKKMKDILVSTKTIASVGLSSNQGKESYGIAAYLKEQGYRIIPVNPTADEILGEKSYPDLSSISEKVDVVQVFRKPEDVPPVVDEAIKIGAKVIWMQEGIWHEEAGAKGARGRVASGNGRLHARHHRRLMIGPKPITL